MVAPPATPWATIFFGIHKEAVLDHFGDRLQLYCRSIDDALGICMVGPDPAEDHRKWTAFKFLMQYYHGLEWIFKKRPDTLNYMDMKISTRKDRIVTSLYEKK